MSDELDISTDMIDVVVMQYDGSLRVDMVRINNSPEVHYAPIFSVYNADDPVYKKLLDITGINKPGDAYSFSLERQKRDQGN